MLLGTAPLRRLSNREYVNTLRDLFPGVTVELPDLPPDQTVSGFENDAPSLGASDVRVARWEEIAFRYGGEVTESASRMSAFLPCASAASGTSAQHACGEQLVREFGKRAFRRPLASDEVGRYVGLFDQQLADIDFEAAVQLTVMALLQSPEFLYRVEIPTDGSSGNVPIDSWQLATRLSYFLWESMPDETLFDAAESGQLATEEQLAAQARRMLGDDRARGAVVDFHRQWLDFDRLGRDEHATRVPDKYPYWNATLRDSIREEEDRFVEGTIFEGEGTLRALLSSRTAWVNGPLAELYDVDGPSDAATWQQVELPADQRAGLLTRAGFLASHSHTGNGSPPLRGVFLTERLFCEQKPTPPPNANLTPPTQAPGEGPKTNRELFEARTAPAECQSCHVRIDGFGMGFENYDAAGAFRDVDNTLPVDSSGNVTGTDVDGPYVGAVELSEILAESETVQGCATRQWVRYAMGRAPETADACLVQRLTDRFSSTHGDVRDLMTAIVTSPEFRHVPAAAE